MTTQQPTQSETAQDPVIMRVGKLEGIAVQVDQRLAEHTETLNTMRRENHAEHQALNDKVDRQGEALRAEIGALGEKVDRQGEAYNAKIDTLRVEMHEKIDRQGEALNEKIDTLRVEMHEKIDRQGEAYNAKIEALNEKVDTLRVEMHEKVDRLRADMYRQGFLIVGALAGLMALFRIID